jgi:hypothetical protein
LFPLTLFALSATWCWPARADQSCPVPGEDIEEVTKQILRKKTCAAAVKLAEACAVGSSRDVGFAGAAAGICERDFAKKKEDAAIYKQLGARCTAKFESSDGTMYRSAEAFCRLRVAQLLSDLNQPAD